VEGDAVPAPLPQYLTFELADRAAGFIAGRGFPDADKSKPFFLFLAFNAPHTPLEAPDEYMEKAKGIGRKDRRICAAMIMALDDAVGRVLDALDASGLARETLVVFLSDNGAALIPGSSENGGSNGPLRGSKAQLWEGGIRVPFLARWPGRIPSGRTVSEPVISLDLFPTLATLAGAARPANLDGLDIGPLLFGEADSLPGRDLCWRFYDSQSAIRSGDWKWTRVAPDMGLFNLRETISESDDRKEAEKARATDLRKRWQDWHAKNPPPRL
jgi:arylsulfatase A-like enzyme